MEIFTKILALIRPFYGYLIFRIYKHMYLCISSHPPLQPAAIQLLFRCYFPGIIFCYP